MSRPLVWTEAGSDCICTKNADGGSTGWTLEDARRLHRELDETIARFDLINTQVSAELRAITGE